MKSLYTLLLALIVSAGVTGCNDDNEIEKNNTQAIIWINKHPRPIINYGAFENSYGLMFYTLKDKDGLIFQTGAVNLKLPDTIN